MIKFYKIHPLYTLHSSVYCFLSVFTLLLTYRYFYSIFRTFTFVIWIPLPLEFLTLSKVLPLYDHLISWRNFVSEYLVSLSLNFLYFLYLIFNTPTFYNGYPQCLLFLPRPFVAHFCIDSYKNLTPFRSQSNLHERLTVSTRLFLSRWGPVKDYIDVS